jgi:hypothetical protein
MYFNYSIVNSPKTNLLTWSLMTGMITTAAFSYVAVYKIDFGHIQNEAEIQAYEVD